MAIQSLLGASLPWDKICQLLRPLTPLFSLLWRPHEPVLSGGFFVPQASCHIEATGLRGSSGRGVPGPSLLSPHPPVWACSSLLQAQGGVSLAGQCAAGAGGPLGKLPPADHYYSPSVCWWGNFLKNVEGSFRLLFYCFSSAFSLCGMELIKIG